MNLILKKALPDIIAVVVFILISFFYFYPADIEGRVLSQGDNSEGNGAGVEMAEYQQRTGERTRWTNSQFSGMPTYQMAPSYNSTDILSKVSSIYHLGLPTYVYFIFIYLLGFYILLRAFDFKAWMAALGAVMWAFSTYFLIIIAAGHIWKVLTLAYIPPTIAGMVLCYKRKYLWGGLVTALFTALQIFSNHVQMTYYFLFVVFFMIIAYAVEAYRKKAWKQFGKSTAAFVIAGLLGVCINLSNLYHTWQYAGESMRGKSELVKQNTANQTNSGLERDYITQWSYGIGETWTLLVPNVRGGASVPLSENTTAMAKADPQLASSGLYQQIGQYWGDQPGTSGPVYVGAFVLFLFFVGICIVRGPMKWALVVATLLSILLSWGHNLMWFTDLFIDYMPMYAKFRTVASILVIAEFTIPLLAMLALKEIWEHPEIMKQKLKIFIGCFVLTGGVALLFAVAPSIASPSFISENEMQAIQGGSLPTEVVGPLIQSLTDMRKAMLTADAWRSFFIVVFGCAILYAYWKKWLNKYLTLGALAILTIVDLWTINTRYLNDSMFVQPNAWKQTFQMTPTDKQILQDKSLDYRVANLAVNTFNETTTSYYHKSIGGYSPAKLRRYQEMIEEHIQPEMAAFWRGLVAAQGDVKKVNPDSIRVLSMLNTKYFIMPLQNNQTMAVQNPYAYGNGWFVKNIQYVNNANEEIDALKRVSPKDVAIVDKKFSAQLPNKVDATGTVQLTSYQPNELKYRIQTSKGGVAVFSEIYYPGWTAKLDGQDVEIGRADYILRAINIPAGNHELVMTFDPASLHETEGIAYAAMAILILVALFEIYLAVKKLKKQQETSTK